MVIPRIRPLSWLLLVSLVACGDPKSPGDTANAASTGASDPGSSGDGATTTTEPATTGATTGTGTTAGTGTTSDAATGTITTGTTIDATTGAPACELVALTCALAEQNAMFEDCSEVDPWNNTVEQWQAARDCALAAVAEQRPFKLITWLQGIDSAVGNGYVGLAGPPYTVERIHYDSYGFGTATLHGCKTLTATDGCIVEPGQACLTCESRGAGEPLCD